MKKMTLIIGAAFMLGSCTQVGGWFGDSEEDSTQQGSAAVQNAAPIMVRDESITAENAYSDLFLDSAAIDSYVKTGGLDAGLTARVKEFYLYRNNQFAWFTSRGITEQARGLWSVYNSSNETAKDEPAAKYRARIDSLLLNDSIQVLAGDTAFINAELALTAQLVNLASENNEVITATNLHWLVPRKKMDALALADSLLTKQTDSSLGNGHPQYAALKKSLQLYYNSAKAGGWPPIEGAATLRKGKSSPMVTALKKRLIATGNYSSADTSTLYNDSLFAAVKQVQEQFGFQPTGVVTDSFLKELNVPATERLQQILVNMNRALWDKPQPQERLVLVNIPSLQLQVFDSGKTILQMPVIVGKEGTGSIVFTGSINQIVFSPYWNLPQSIIQNEIKPAIAKDPGYLKKKNMEIVKQDDSLPQIRQMPGKDNALGKVKFMFPNSFDIYLHDTPNKGLFAQGNRALSHGCIRVAKPDSLALYLLRNDAGWSFTKIVAAMNSGKETTVKVKDAMPVAITYYTSWVAPNGQLNFRKDIYEHDKKAAALMFKQA